MTYDPNPNVIHLRPLDKLIVYSSESIPDSVAQNVREQLAAELNWPKEDILILTNMKLAVLRR